MSITFPKLRPSLQLLDGPDPWTILLVDDMRLGGPVQLARAALPLLRLFDGTQSLTSIHSFISAANPHSDLSLETLQQFVDQLDEVYYLDSPRLQRRLEHPDRWPSCIGCYEADPTLLRAQLSELFTAPGGPGLPVPEKRLHQGQLRGVLVPHIDYERGGVSYGWGFHELIERTDASLFVIIATSHYSMERFTLTRKNFVTPLGTVPTDQPYIDRLVHHYGPGLFDDPLAHLPEHSIELEVVLLHYLLEKQRPFRIVPLLVGSFGDCVPAATLPERRPDIARMIAALRAAEAETSERICYIISGDLAHIGPKFDDPEPVAEPFLAHSYAQDQALLKQTEQASATGYFRIIAQEQDARRICGLPPTYTFLQAIAPRSGRILQYGRYVEPKGFESVSFASVAFAD